MKNKKLFLVAAVVLMGLGFCLQAQADIYDCSDDCSVDSDCSTGQKCVSAVCSGQTNLAVSICSSSFGSGATSGVSTTYTCANTRGQSCYSNNCEDSGRNDGSGTCASGQYCCAGSYNYTCEDTSGQSCNSINCEDAILDDGAGTCASGEYCCKRRSISTAYTCTNTSGQHCDDVNCEDENLDDGSGTCASGKYCCKARASINVDDDDDEKDSPSGTAWNVESAGKFGLPTGTISGIVQSLVSWILGIFGFLGIITFVIAGIMYFVAAGDADQEKSAKNAMKMGIIGIVVGLLGLVIIQAVDLLLRAETGF